MTDQLQKSIFQTLTFFDIFEHPLTREELFKLLITDNPDLRISYADFLQQIDSFENKNSFYFLPGRESIVETRQRRVKIIEQKMKIAMRGIKKLRWVPFVQAVFVCNTVAMGFADENSDIDVFIIVKKGRIWLARLLATIVLSLFGLRRTKNKIKNKICLSFYTTDNNLDLSQIAIEQTDTYLIYWIASLIPVYDTDNLQEKIIEKNKWVGKYLLNGLKEAEYRMWNMEYRGFFKRIFEKMWDGRYGDWLEAQAKSIQQIKMKMNLHSRQNESGTAVVVSDEMLKFHENDRRMEYRQQWLAKCKNLI